MSITSNTTLRWAQWIRWSALVISSLAALSWLLLLIVILLCELVVGCISVTWETGFLMLFVVASVLSVTIAWRRENIGGLVLIIWGLAFAIIAHITSRPDQVFSMLVSGFPFVIAGLLLLTSERMLRKADLNN